MNKPLREGFITDDQALQEELPPPPQLKQVAALEARQLPTYDELAAENEKLRADNARLRALLEAPPPDQWPLVIKLRHKSIKTDTGKIVDRLSLREATAMDIVRAGGNPVITELAADENGQPTYKFIIDDPRMFKIMSSMSEIMEGYLQNLHPNDYNSVAYKLRRFFVPEQGVW